MAGICAVLGSDAEQLARRICKCIQHRGPDGEGFFVDGDVALGYRELYIENAPVSHQPLANENGTIWITFDGQIYNSVELKSTLEKRHSFKGDSPAEVIVHSYEEEGFKCLSKLNGMFAFCLWDSDKQTLFSARDRVGSKPLYYCKHNNLFLLSSEIKGLLSIASMPRKPNDRKIYDYLMGESHNPDETFFLGISNLLPGHYLIADKDLITIHQYWSPTKAHLVAEGQDYVSDFRKLFRDSVRIQLPVNLPFATFLSGGLDSPSIAFVIDETLNQTLAERTGVTPRQELFSAIYNGSIEQGDERPYIEEVVRALGTKTNYVFPLVTGQWNDIKQFVYYLDEPVLVFNYFVFWCLSKEASRKVRVVFYGMTGGEVYGAVDSTINYLRYIGELARKKKIARLLIESIGVLPRITVYSISSINSILSHDKESKINELLDPRFVSECELSKKQQPIGKKLNSEYLHFRDSLVDHLRVCDRVSSAFFIEPRYPFLDHRIIEFFFHIPVEQKIRNGQTKYILRKAMKGILPEAVRKTRKKFGTPIPIERWMRELQKNIANVFESEKFRERGYFNQDAVLELFDRYCNGKLGRVERQYYSNVLWRNLKLELWFEVFVDQQANTISLNSAFN
jgi:asparagine synthase (glutamine-hydrolysing)